MEDQAVQHQKWWHKFIRPLLVVGIVTASMLNIALIVGIIGGYLFNWDWTGLSPYSSPPHSSSSDFQRGKTLWDWVQLLFIPVVLAVAGFWFNHRERKAAELRDENERKNADRHNQTEREIAQDNQHEAVLQEYIDKMSELLLHEKLRESQPGDEVRTIARVRTLSVLSRLNSNRKRTVFNFLLESRLIGNNNHVVNIEKADFSDTYIGLVDLTEAKLRFVNFERAVLDSTTLVGANLMGANLKEADLEGADLKGAKLRFANLEGADLTNADLTGAEVTNRQLAIAKSLKGTTMPQGYMMPGGRSTPYGEL